MVEFGVVKTFLERLNKVEHQLLEEVKDRYPNDSVGLQDT